MTTLKDAVVRAAAAGPLTEDDIAGIARRVAAGKGRDLSDGRALRSARDVITRLRRQDLLTSSPDGFVLTPAGRVAVGDEPTQDTILTRLLAMEDAGIDLTDIEREKLRLARATLGGDDWRVCLPALFPSALTRDFAPCHTEFLDHVWRIGEGVAPPFVMALSRGMAKSTLLEIAAIMLGARGVRRYCWYVSATADSARDHLNSIEALLGAPEFASVYPDMASRGVTSLGGQKEWRVDRLSTAGGVTFDAVGLNQAVRGRRYETSRPDLIIIDDIDEAGDTHRQIEKRIRTLSQRILPSRSDNAVVLAAQNIIHGQSIFARLLELEGAPEIDILHDRVTLGPVPLVEGLTWERRQSGRGYRITGGTPSWPAAGIEAAQAEMDQIGLSAFLIECQHQEGSLGGGVGEHIPFDELLVSVDQLPELVAVVGTVDPAVTSTDRSDSCGIVVDALGVDRRVYRFYAWERVVQPVEALTRAIEAVCDVVLEDGLRWRRGADVVVLCETDQGGDTWRVVYQEALRKLVERDAGPVGEVMAEIQADDDDTRFPAARLPRFEQVKASQSGGSKADRVEGQVAYYENGRVWHVRDSHGRSRVQVLEAGLRRFPVHKPYDCADAGAHGLRWCLGRAGESRVGRKPVRARAPSGGMPAVPAHSATGYNI